MKKNKSMKYNLYRKLIFKTLNIQCFVHNLLTILGVPLCWGFCGPCFRIGKKTKLPGTEIWVRYCKKCARVDKESLQS